MALHKNLTGCDIHVINAFTYATSAAREGATGLTPSDIYKVAVQTDDYSVWLLIDDSPVTWIPLGGGGGGAVTFLGLVDTPSSYTGEGGQFVAVNIGETALEFVDPPSGAGVADFLSLTDTPSAYIGAGGYTVVVNVGETGLEFTLAPSGGVTVHGNLLGLGADDHTQYMPVSASRAFTEPVSGIDPTLDEHLTTKFYVDTLSDLASANACQCAENYTDMQVAIVSAGIIKDHGLLNGLADDDHILYVPTSGGRGFSVPISGSDPILDEHLATKFYTDAASGNACQCAENYTDMQVAIVSAGIIKDHGALNGLQDDDHMVYVPVSGGRGFTVPISGADPILDNHLATKLYTDAASANALFESSQYTDIQTALASAAGCECAKDYVDTYFMPLSGGLFTNPVSGQDPTLDDHLTTKFYVDTLVETISANLDEHSELKGLIAPADDHTQYAHIDGRRAFTAPVSGIDPILDNHLATKLYTDSASANALFQANLYSDLTSANALFQANNYTDIQTDAASAAGCLCAQNYVNTFFMPLSGGLFTNPVSGQDPLLDEHLTTKWYVDTLSVLASANACQCAQNYTDMQVAIVSAGIIKDHGLLQGLSDDDHLQYMPIAATRAFTAPVSGIDPTLDEHLTTKFYVDAVIPSGGGVTAHSLLTGLPAPADDHTQYMHIDGRRAFTAPVTGVDPIFDNHLATKLYTDAASANALFQANLYSDLTSANALFEANQYTDLSSALASAAGCLCAQEYVDTFFMPLSGGLFTNPVSGQDPLLDNHLVTKIYVDTLVDTVSAGIITDHGLLNGLTDDDHPQYVPRTGVRGFTATVSGFDPVIDEDLTTKFYVDTLVDTVSANLDEHSELKGLVAPADDHTQYAHIDGRRAFTAPVSGEDPILDNHLATKFYTDAASGNAETQANIYTDMQVAIVSAGIIKDHGLLSGLGDDDHPQYMDTIASRAFTNPVSGIDPTLDEHLTTKFYVDTEITEATSAADVIEKDNVESESESQTSSSTYQEKTSLSVSVSAGDWMLMWYAEGRNQSVGDAIEIRIQQDNTTTHAENRFYSGDAGGVNWLEDFYPFTGHRILTLAEGSYDFDIDYRSVSGGTTEIRRARITLWRMS